MFRNSMMVVLMLVVLVATSILSPASSEAVVLNDLNGRWKLDWDRSESLEPAMKALEVSWLLRKMAGVISIYVTLAVEPPSCEDCDPSLQIKSENPIKNTERVVVLDGVARPFTDPIGNQSMDQFTWHAERGMEMVRNRMLKSGKAARIHERRTVNEDLTMMESIMTVWVDGEQRATVKRILVKVDSEN
jgi:hypothetical protein